MSLQYFETLKSLGEGESSKFIFPMEFSKFLGPLGAVFDSDGSSEDDD